MFLNVFEDYFSYYLGDGKEHADSSQMVTLKAGAIFEILTIILLFHSLEKVSNFQDFRMIGTIERTAQTPTNLSF